MELHQRTQETDRRSLRPWPNLRQFEHKKKDGVVAKNSGEAWVQSLGRMGVLEMVGGDAAEQCECAEGPKLYT